MFTNTVDSDVARRIQEFDNRHGNFVCYADRLYFEDGACRERDPIGKMVEVPPDKHQRAKRVLVYWKLKLDLAVRHFDTQKQHGLAAAQSMVNYGGHIHDDPNDQIVENLKKLKLEVDKIKAHYEEAEKAVTGTVPEEQKEKEQQTEECKQKWREHASKLQSIEI